MARAGRPRHVATAGLTVLVLALGGSAVILGGATTAEPDDAATLDAAPGDTRRTAAVTRQDLVRTETLTGSLSFGDARQVSAFVDGVVTSVAGERAQVDVGGVVYAVDNEPTVLLAGSIPAYRDLSTDASDGPDIAQLEQALLDGGFGPEVTVDGDFDDATADAVEAWEESLGRADPDATVTLGDVLFATAALQVAAVTAPVGAQVSAGDPVLEATSTVKQVDLDVSVDRADDIAVGTAVGLDLPDGSAATGVVTDVGSAEANADPTAEDTVPVVVTLDSVDAAACCTSGSVDVTIERSRDVDVLTVPVAALLALAEGGYAVEVVDPGAASGTRLVAVDPGGYADDLVAVTGLDEGTDVVVAG